MAPDAARERDVHRYFQPWKNSKSSVATPRPTPSSTAIKNHELPYQGIQGRKLHTSTDRALTAFAQLATHRLNLRRCIISLIDKKHQYILTEATRTLSLVSLTSDHSDDRAFFGASIVDPGDFMCAHAMDSSYTASDEYGNTYTAEALVVPDLTKHEIFKTRHFVTGPAHLRFYAGVPIVSSSGYRIGVYTVADKCPRDGLTIEELKFLQEMAVIVMEHLQMTRDREDRNKGERMVRGLAEFIEGSCAQAKDSIQSRQPLLPKPIAELAAKGTATTVMERQTENLRTLSMEDEHSHDRLHPNESASRITGPNATKANPYPEPSNPNCIFYRAADLIRKSTFADGAVFFRASGSAIRTTTPDTLGHTDHNSMDDSQSGTSGSDMYGSPSKHKSLMQSRSFSKPHPSIEKDDTKHCEVLGLSVSEDAPGEDRLCVKEFAFSEKSMERFIKKFPFGKFFSFTETGTGVSSGDSEKEGIPNGVTSGQKLGDNTKSSNHHRAKKQKFIPTELLKILPGIRSLIFLPLFDIVVERWVAGAFIWTTNEGALTNPDNDLPYLKAFGNSIISEYARMNALISDRAKTSFIASVSHELRSPLHGILGSVEFLNETDATTYQTGLIASIETCGKTLLDTIDHVLDYAKINKLNNRDRSTSRRFESRVARRENESSIMGPYAEVDLNILVEEVCEAVCAGHAFRENRLDAASSGTKNGAPASNLGHVSVSVQVCPRLRSLVRTQPGAVRRIVMNLLGNALKYTNIGFIAVTMDARPSQSDLSKVVVVITVQDSGKGMSLEYQRTRLFSPFSQEDSFSDGTGLGLSIVRQIIDSLGGSIEIQSTQGFGTKAEVHLTLPVSEGQETDEMAETRVLSKGKRVCLLGHTCVNEKYLESCATALVKNSREWFDLEILHAGTDVENMVADAVICAENSTYFDKMNFSSVVPIIVVCKNQTDQMALRKRLIASLPEPASVRLEIVAQPLGPQKLGNVFKRIFSRVYHENLKMPIPRTLSGTINHHPNPTQEPASQTPNGTPLRRLVATASVPVPSAINKEVPPEPHRAATAPLQKDPSAIEQKPIPIRLKNGLSTLEQPPSTHHVLLVDDNTINLQLLVMFMKKISLPYASAVDGLQALEKYKSCAPCPKARPPVLAQSPTSLRNPSQQCLVVDLGSPAPTANGTIEVQFTYVLMDISMPVMDGLESTRRIRRYEQENGLRKAVIIALTGLASAEAQRDALEAGVDFYLPKPVRFADLKRLLDV